MKSNNQEKVVQLMGEMQQSKAKYKQLQSEKMSKKKQLLDNKLKAT